MGKERPEMILTSERCSDIIIVANTVRLEV